MSTKSLAAKRFRLWQENPKCYHCGKTTIYKPSHIKGLYTADERDLLATIDHIRPRHHPDRLKLPKPGEVLQVLSCWRCNNDRDRKELAEKPKEWFEQNGGSKPLAKRSTDELLKILKCIRRYGELAYPDPSIRKLGRHGRWTWNKVKKSQTAVIWALWERGWEKEGESKMTSDDVGMLPDRTQLLWNGKVVVKDSAVSYALGTVRVEDTDGFTHIVPVSELQRNND